MASAFDKFVQGLIGSKSKNPVNLIAERFIRIFKDHGVAVSQIPRLLPQIQFSNLQSEGTLLPILNYEILEQTAELFGIRRQWLEGIDDQIYEPHYCYKDPAIFFRDLTAFCHRKSSGLYLPVRVFTIRKNLDNTDSECQPLAMVLVEQITTLDDKGIFRFHVFNDQWNWSYAPARIQIKAMVRLVSAVINVQVPLYVIESNTLEALLKGTIVPNQLIGKCLISDPSLEDYAVSNANVSREKDELPEVINYIEEHQLEGVITKELGECVKKSETSSVHSENLQKTKRSDKRARNQEEVWRPARSKALELWREDNSLSIAEVVRCLKTNQDLKVSVLGESGIRKRIADLAPENIRGKSGRKSKKLT